VQRKTTFALFIVHFCRHMKLPTIDSLPLYPVFKGAKTNQQRSGEKGSRSLGPAFHAGLPCAARKKQTPRKVANAPPSRLTALCCAARLCEMALWEDSTMYECLTFREEKKVNTRLRMF